MARVFDELYLYEKTVMLICCLSSSVLLLLKLLLKMLLSAGQLYKTTEMPKLQHSVSEMDLKENNYRRVSKVRERLMPLSINQNGNAT